MEDQSSSLFDSVWGAMAELLTDTWLDNWLMIIPLMIICLFLNMRVYLAMFTGIVTYFLCYSDVPMAVAVQRLIAPTQNPSLLAIPFFILLGTLMSYTGIAERILHIANVLVGKMRGGLGVANILVSTMMGGVSASNLADAAMLSRMMVPEMERKGYNRAFAAAITAGGSLVTPIIPPGIALILYGLVADVSIGKMFMAGLVPGLICAVVLMFTVYLVARKKDFKPSRDSWPTGKEVVYSLGQAWPALFLIFAVVGGIRANIFTPTEAGAAAVLIVLIIGFVIYREMRIVHIYKALGETARSTASVMLVIMASAALGWIFSLERAGITVAEFVTGLTENKYVFLLIINAMLLALGMFLEGNAILLILVPLLKPIVEHFGIDPVHFGIIMIFNLSIGAYTPPVGTVMLLVCNITQVSVGQFFKQSLPLLCALLVMLLLVTYIPAISLALV
jgi:tripartite ATP-independent transporter DctM subunit